MRTYYDIISALFQTLKPVLDITGELYIGQEPTGQQKENVTIDTLDSRNGYVQTGIININLFAQGIKGEMPNLKRMKEIMTVIIDTVENKNLFVDGVTVMTEIQSDGGVKVLPDNPGRFYHNLRVEFVTL